MNVFKGNEQIRQFAEGLQANKVLVVCDINTRPFSNQTVGALKAGKREVVVYCFEEKHLVPEIANLGELLEKAKSYEYILAVGSGTLNDICKYASFKCGVPYGIYATAPSMDGYVSSVSALYDNGKKVTLPTTIPTDVLIDVSVLKDAPLDMIVAGAGDMVGKYTSLLDWKLANVLTGERYDTEIVGRMEKAVELCMSQARALVERSESAVSALIDGLIYSGIEMQNAGNSRPASGCEHHISHYLEMAAEKLGTHFAPHGVQVALGSFVGNSLYRYALEKYPEELAPVAADINALPTVADLKQLYKEISLPYHFKDIGVNEALLAETIANAYTVRERFTVMSFLKDKGDLSTVAKTLAAELI